MRLWHVALLNRLPKQWIQGQHKECCMLRGKNWTRNHSTVDYIKKYTLQKLFWYHLRVMHIAIKKYDIKVDTKWLDITYRGKSVDSDSSLSRCYSSDYTNYPEHNEEYLQECIENLHNKGVVI